MTKTWNGSAGVCFNDRGEVLLIRGFNSEKQEAEKADDQPAKEKIVYKTVLTVSDGMTSIDVGNALEKANIIKDGLDFYKRVEKRWI